MPAIPTRAGFYWAKWRICDEGTADEAEFEPSNIWEVVEVFENGSDEIDPEWLRVHVPGVEHGQAVENFIWGPGPLAPPAEEACGSREAAGETHHALSGAHMLNRKRGEEAQLSL